MAHGDRPTVRALTAGDRAGWQALWDGYLAFYETALPPGVTDTTFARLLDPAEPMHALVAERAGEMVGVAHYLLHRSTWSDCYGYLEDLYALPAARGQGIGRALVAAVESATRDAGATRLYWVTRADNARARRLYDSVADATDFVQYRKSLSVVIPGHERILPNEPGIVRDDRVSGARPPGTGVRASE